jgi:phosphatidylinositol glycan class K
MQHLSATEANDHIDRNPELKARPRTKMGSFTYTFACLALYLALASATHTSNWAVLVSTSRFWFNYRHLANVLSIYRTVKRLGIPDSQIILMLSDDMACNPRNSFPGTVFNDKSRLLDLYDDKGTGDRTEAQKEGMGGIEVDFRGNEVTVENFIRLLTNRWPSSQPVSKRLMTDDRSNILIYMTGHGGNEFLKFQDAEEISSFDLANAFEQMWEKKRYNELLFMIDTCQANTMYRTFYTPNIIATGSSAKDQSSYSHHADQDVGVAVIDRWTYANLEFLESRMNSTSSDVRLGELFDYYTFDRVHSEAGVRHDLFPGGREGARDRRVLDFFGNVQGVEVDSAGDESTASWQADLKKLELFVELAKAEEEEAIARENQAKPAESSDKVTVPTKQDQPKVALDMAHEGRSWLKQAVGVGSLLTLGAAWIVVK